MRSTRSRMVRRQRSSSLGADRAREQQVAVSEAEREGQPRHQPADADAGAGRVAGLGVVVAARVVELGARRSESGRTPSRRVPK